MELLNVSVFSHNFSVGSNIDEAHRGRHSSTIGFAPRATASRVRQDASHGCLAVFVRKLPFFLLFFFLSNFRTFND